MTDATPDILKIGDRLPGAMVYAPDIINENRPREMNIANAFSSGLHAVFVMPLAHSPTCEGQHLAQLLPLVDQFADLDTTISILTSSDTFATGKWAEIQQVPPTVRFFCDPNRNLARALPAGLRYDRPGVGNDLLMRASMVIHDGTIQSFAAETSAGNCTVSSAQPLLEAVQRLRGR